MKAHVITDGKVSNTIVVESLDVLPNLVKATEGGIGWTYANGVFTAPPEPEVVEPEPAPAPTKEELLAQLNAIAAQIQALE
jgi:hypothetical protein